MARQLAIRHPKIMAALDYPKESEPWDRTIVKVMPQECANCLLGDDPVVGAEEVQALLDAVAIDGRVFECHLASIAGKGRCCYRFFREGRSLVVRLAQLYGWWVMMDIRGNYCCVNPEVPDASP